MGDLHRQPLSGRQRPPRRGVPELRMAGQRRFLAHRPGRGAVRPVRREHLEDPARVLQRGGGYGLGDTPTYNNMEITSQKGPINRYWFELVRRQARNVYLNMEHGTEFSGARWRIIRAASGASSGRSRCTAFPTGPTTASAAACSAWPATPRSPGLRPDGAGSADLLGDGS